MAGVQLAGTPDLPLLVVGPSLGTSVTALWGQAAGLLGDRFHVVGWDLPGHGHNRAANAAFTVADLAAAVLDLADRVLAERGEPAGSFLYAGDSVGGAVGLQLLLDAPGRIASAVLLCTGARIGDPQSWHDRAAAVRASGTPVMVEASARRWFGPGFLDRQPPVAAALLHSLQDADAEGYAAACEALAAFDVRDRLAEITAPVLVVAGADDVATPPALGEAVASGVRAGRVVVLPGVAHLAPAEAPAEVARLIGGHLMDLVEIDEEQS